MGNARTVWGALALTATIVGTGVAAVTVASSRVEGAADDISVWAVHDGEKVKRDDRQNANKVRNAIWDGARIKLVASRNEIVAFQVIVEAGAAGVERLSATLPSLTLTAGKGKNAGGGGDAIAYKAPATDPTDYRSRPIQIFTQHYLHVTEATRATWVFHPDTAAAPKNPLGWTPVALVPENATAGRGGFPVRVAANQNQGLWFDIYVGRDRKPGMYRGEVTIAADKTTRRIQVDLEVLDVALPDENSLRAMIYYQQDQPELYHGRKDLDAAYHRFAKRNRVEFVQAYDQPRAQAAIGRFRGTDFTSAQGYEGPGEGVGYRIIPRSFYGPGRTFTDRTEAWRAADEWMTFVGANLPNAYTFLYMPDEPRPAQFPEIVALADHLRANPGPGKALPRFVTHAYTPELAAAIDIWCAVPSHYDLSRAASERAAGKQYWFYNGGRPQIGAIIIDSPAIDSRMVGWAAFKHGADGYFYWHADHWRHNSQKKVGDRNQDVWVNPITFDNRSETKPDQGFINGDGVLIYPGQDVLHPEQDRGIAGPVSTIQMANLRRGLQDHMVLTMARGLGLNEAVDSAVGRVVPRVFSDVTRDSPVGFSENGNDYEEARQAVLRAIAAHATTQRPAKSSAKQSPQAQQPLQARKQPPMPSITKPVMFDTPEADAILAALQVFPPDNPWNQDISSLPLHADSTAIIARIGADKPLEYNLDMGFIIVPANQRRVDVKLLDYPAESDPGPYPVPDNAPIENWPMQKNEHAAAVTKPGQTLEQLQREGTGDRHIIVVDPGNGKFHEFWQSRKTDAGWQASNEATFDLRTGALRPERWTSGDAAGLPIFPAVIRYDEVERGMVEHAMRFTVRRTRRGYVLPATHWASPHKDRDLPRMGERFRLRQDFDISGFPPHAQAILRGLKKHGMFVADNGADWYMSIAPDRRFKGLETLARVKGSDFEVIDTGARSVEDH
jgi:hypothetical protein